MASETEPLINAIPRQEDQFTPILYKKRWYILILYACFSFTQSSLCDVWAVIANSAEGAFGWRDSDVSLIEDWNYVVYVVVVLPVVVLVSKAGVRAGVVASLGFVLLATALRALTPDMPAVLWLAHVAGISNSAAGPVSFMCGPVISAAWFPAEERALATSVAALANMAGTSATFLLGPHLVSSPEKDANGTVTNAPEMRHQIITLRRGELAWVGLLFIAAVVHFPSKPPSPPSYTASLDRIPIFAGTRRIFSRQNAKFWLVALPYGVSAGMYGLWCVFLDVILKPRGISEQETGWLGFVSIVAALVTGLFVGKLADKFPHHTKTFALVFLGGAVVSTYVVLILAEGYVVGNKGTLYVSVVAVGIFANAACPLFYELACDVVYPVPEAVASATLTVAYCLFPIIALTFPALKIPDASQWMTWGMFIGLVLSAPLLALCPSTRTRLVIDTAHAPRGTHD